MKKKKEIKWVCVRMTFALIKQIFIGLLTGKMRAVKQLEMHDSTYSY